MQRVLNQADAALGTATAGHRLAAPIDLAGVFNFRFLGEQAK